jgi:carbon monoxide dehydrogenase subunit G
MQFSGEQRFAMPLDAIWSRLSDARFLVDCLTDVTVLRRETDVATWKLKPAFSFVTGSLDTTLTLSNRQHPVSQIATVFSKGIGATTTVVVRLEFAATDTGCRVQWQAEITALTGLLKAVPKGLIQAAAAKVIADVWAAVARRLQAESAI